MHEVDAGVHPHLVLDLSRIRVALSRHHDIHVAIATSLQHRTSDVPSTRMRCCYDDAASVGNAVVIIVRPERARIDDVSAIRPGKHRFREAMRVVAKNGCDFEGFLCRWARSKNVFEVCLHAASRER